MFGDFPGVPAVKNLPSNAGAADSIPGWGTKIPRAAGQLNLHAATREKPACLNYWARALWSPRATTREACAPQLERSPQQTACTPQWKPSTATKKKYNKKLCNVSKSVKVNRIVTMYAYHTGLTNVTFYKHRLDTAGTFLHLLTSLPLQ